MVEVVDEHDDAVPPGTPGAKVLITNLVNFAQPLIRYEISDAVTLAAGNNPTGRPYRRIAAIDGRTVEVLHLPARDGGQAAVHPSVLGAAFASSPEVHQYQFVYDGRVLQARVVLDPDAPAEVLDRLRRSLERAIAATGALPPSIEIRPVTALRREPGPGQKIMLVKTVRPGDPAMTWPCRGAETTVASWTPRWRSSPSCSVTPSGPIRSPARTTASTGPATPPRGRRSAVVRARDAAEVQACMRWASEHGVPVVPRGAGSGLSGGSSAVDGGIVLSLERMRAIEIDVATRVAVVEPGAFNAEVKAAAAAAWPVVPTRPLLLRDLLDRRQHRHQRRRAVLRQVRGDHRLRPRPRRGAGRRHPGQAGRQTGQGRGRAVPGEAVRRQRGHPRHRDPGDPAADPGPGRTVHPGRHLPHRGRRGRRRGRHRRDAAALDDGADGRRVDQRGRGLPADGPGPECRGAC